MQPIVSVIVPCYNQAQYLSEALESVLAQTISNWECVIVNDGSMDNTLEIANEWARRDSRFVVVDKANGGPSDARNVGIRASKGKYILPLDGDDKIAPTYLQKAVDYLECHNDTKLVYCVAEYFGDENKQLTVTNYEYDRLLWQNLIFCSAVYRRSDYDKTIGYNVNMKYGYEDWDFWLALLNKYDKVYRIPEVEFYYRRHGVSRTTEADNKHNENLKQILLNHMDLYKPFLGDMFLAIQRINNLEKEVVALRNSKSFRLGYAIMSKLEWFKSKMFPNGNEHK